MKPKFKPRKIRKLAMETVGRPMLRGSITVIGAVGWFILSVFIFQVYLPQFGFYNQIIINEGTTQNDVWFIWAWIPTLLILVLGIFWSSGMFGKLWRIMQGL